MKEKRTQDVQEIEDRLNHARRWSIEFGRSLEKADAPWYTEIALRLLEICRELHGLDEENCNSGWDKEQEKQVEELEKEASTLAKKLGFIRAYHQSDPRGWSLYLIKKLKRGQNIDSYYSEGLGVPIW